MPVINNESMLERRISPCTRPPGRSSYCIQCTNTQYTCVFTKSARIPLSPSIDNGSILTGRDLRAITMREAWMHKNLGDTLHDFSGCLSDPSTYVSHVHPAFSGTCKQEEVARRMEVPMGAGTSVSGFLPLPKAFARIKSVSARLAFLHSQFFPFPPSRLSHSTHNKSPRLSAKATNPSHTSPLETHIFLPRSVGSSAYCYLHCYTFINPLSTPPTTNSQVPVVPWLTDGLRRAGAYAISLAIPQHNTCTACSAHAGHPSPLPSSTSCCDLAA